MNTHKLTFAAVAAMAVTLSVAMLVSSIATPVAAKITPAQPPSCENRGGQQPGGQQPTCTGEGLTQNPGTPATNPADHAPPGHNK
ncbi:MAG: hypothetical protein M3261_01110 [Thermoproteota archaeon]|nr:hypothetical protein [Thermoproteota archaeon]